MSPAFSHELGKAQLFPLGNRRMKKGTTQTLITTSWYARIQWRGVREVPGAAGNSRPLWRGVLDLEL